MSEPSGPIRVGGTAAGDPDAIRGSRHPWRHDGGEAAVKIQPTLFRVASKMPSNRLADGRGEWSSEFLMAIIPSSKLILSISLLGGFSLRVAGRGVVSIPRKARALLAYLSMQEGQSVSRETIADLLWTDRGVEQARHSLRQTLLVMRRDLGPDVLRHDGQELSLAPDLVETDATRFRTLGRSADRAALAEAAELYVGPFLHRFPAVAADFDDWADAARNELT
ncbi:MAG: hypothetical protein AB7O80_23070, partial [Acetobacteraceae bacterium]